MFKNRINIYQLKTDSAWNILKNTALIIIVVINKLFSLLGNIFFPHNNKYLNEKTAQKI